MEEVSKKFIKNLVYFGILIIFILAFWAADWWSWKLIVTIPLGIVAYYSIAYGCWYRFKASQGIDV